MRAPAETAKYQTEVFHNLDLLLDSEAPEVVDFYRALNHTDEPLSVEFLATIAPYWGGFIHSLEDGETHAYARKPIVEIENPVIVATDAPTAGGKTTVTLETVRRHPEFARLIRSCTTRELRPEERENVKKVSIYSDPLIEAEVSTQYVRITTEEFRILSEKGFFLEELSQFGTKDEEPFFYGIPKQYLLNAIEKRMPFTYIIVNKKGQDVVQAFLKTQTNAPDFQRWFILPTMQTFRDLRDRIIFQRSSEKAGKVASRLYNTINDLYTAELADVIIPNPYETSRKPNQALENVHELMHVLRPDVVVAAVT